ncbi:MAG: SIS domain-containing protein [Vicinamibacteria bacterium]
MPDRRRAIVDRGLAAAAETHLALRAAGAAAVAEAAGAVVGALREGHAVLVFGNGGSAADAQHFAAELVGRFVTERRALPAVALTTDTSALTALANDYGYDRVFARQVEALGREGDVAIGITTSGASANVLAAFEAARARGLVTIALTGRDGGAAGRAAAIHVNVASDVTARIQEAHMTALHLICEIVDEELGGDGY